MLTMRFVCAEEMLSESISSVQMTSLLAKLKEILTQLPSRVLLMQWKMQCVLLRWSSTEFPVFTNSII